MIKFRHHNFFSLGLTRYVCVSLLLLFCQMANASVLHNVKFEAEIVYVTLEREKISYKTLGLTSNKIRGEMRIQDSSDRNDDHEGYVAWPTRIYEFVFDAPLSAEFKGTKLSVISNEELLVSHIGEKFCKRQFEHANSERKYTAKEITDTCKVSGDEIEVDLYGITTAFVPEQYRLKQPWTGGVDLTFNEVTKKMIQNIKPEAVISASDTFVLLKYIRKKYRSPSGPRIEIYLRITSMVAQ